MGNAVFPVLPGLAWGNTKSPTFKTTVHRSVSGMEARVASMAYPLWEFSLTYEVLRAASGLAEIQALMGFFASRQGSFDSFLYSDPSDSSVSAHSFGAMATGTSAYQLTRTYGGFTEPVHNLNGTPQIYVNGTLTTPASISSTGLVTFSSVTNLAALTWTGSFYYRCRFQNDTNQFTEMLQDLWESKQVSFVGSPMNKV